MDVIDFKDERGPIAKNRRPIVPDPGADPKDRPLAIL
jgi:hypothetical protein